MQSPKRQNGDFMQIHTVQNGDTVFGIARKYSVSPMKIIENNNLSNPDRLSVGQKLLILTPTRTYTVRGGDTLASIAKRFGVCEEELYILNPSLMGEKNLYPTQVLVIKQDERCCGMALSNGYLYDAVGKERFSLILPHLTHLTVGAYEMSKDKITRLWNAEKYIDAAKEKCKIILMRIYSSDPISTFDGELIDKMVKCAKDGGFNGITLAAYRAFEESASEFSKFAEALYKKTLSEGLLLYIEIDANKKQNLLPDFADGYILMYEKMHLQEIPAFKDGEKEVFTHYTSIGEGSKMFMDFSPFGVKGSEPILKKDAENSAYNSKSEIKYDKERGICYFDHTEYKGGKREDFKVIFEALENKKAKFDLLFELGMIGMSFDILRVPIEELLMFASMFTLPDTECFAKIKDY